MSTTTADQDTLEGTIPDDVPPSDKTDKRATKKAATKKAATKKAPAAPRGPGRPSKRDQQTQQLTELFITLAGAGQVATMANPRAQADFAIVANASPSVAAALVKLGEQQPAVAKLIETMTTTGAYGELLTVLVGGIVLPILANHGVLPPGFAGMNATAPDVAAA